MSWKKYKKMLLTYEDEKNEEKNSFCFNYETSQSHKVSLNVSEVWDTVQVQLWETQKEAIHK